MRRERPPLASQRPPCLGAKALRRESQQVWHPLRRLQVRQQHRRQVAGVGAQAVPVRAS